MPKVAQDVLDEFGRAVKRARSLRGWTLDQVANCITPPPGKSFLSKIEKGKRDISATTVGKLIGALDLPESWIDKFLDTDIAPEDEETPKDREAERLIRRAEADPNAPKTPEALLLLLAEEWAGQRFTDFTHAYNALQGALQAAAEMRAQGAMPSNISGQFQAVMRRVAELNDAGLMDEADAALKEAADRHEAEGEALFEAALKQDRLRNRPEAAAQRLIKRLRGCAQIGGLFAATQTLLVETLERGEREGNLFDIAVALELAKANRDRAKGAQIPIALSALGDCHLALGERQVSGGHLTRARNAHTEALRLTSRLREPFNWAVCQANLGNALIVIGQRTADPAVVKRAVAAHQSALSVFTRAKNPENWAKSQNNLGNALGALAKLISFPAILEQALDAYRACQVVYTKEALPENWASIETNIGNVLSSLGENSGNPLLLEIAVASHRATLSILKPDKMPMGWASAQNSLGISLRRLAAINKDEAATREAKHAFFASLTKSRREDMPFLWAGTQWNLADLALLRYTFSHDAEHLNAARHHLAMAREVFSEEGNDEQLAKCDQLQAQIDAA